MQNTGYALTKPASPRLMSCEISEASLTDSLFVLSICAHKTFLACSYESVFAIESSHLVETLHASILSFVKYVTDVGHS